MLSASKTATTSGGYQISRSLRFNFADVSYLNRTPASASNRKTWTWSVWVKRSGLNNGAAKNSMLFSSRPTASPYTQIQFGNSDALSFYANNNSTSLTTSAVYRDVSAWYHIVVTVDTTQATSSSRIIFYVNGVQQTISGTYPSQNDDLNINTTDQHRIGNYQFDGTSNLDGYMTEVNFIDGQALTPSSFGYTDPDTGVWSPLAFVGTYGTNGFYLNFSDNSNTTAATLGKDYSGNGNNWTPNNFSVTAGAGNDSLVDSPTSYGTDTGVGGTVRGNYSTLNPLTYLNATFANGNLDTVVAVPETSNAVGTFGVSSGKWYWEVTPTTTDAGMIGICDISASATNRSWQSANGWSYFKNGNKYNNNTGSAYGASWVANDVIGVALDMDAGTLVFYKNGTSQGTAYSTGLTGKTITAYLGNGNGGGGASQYYSCNFGQRPFAYTAPSGFKALCTQNLPTPTIGATTATLASKFFNTVTYTGNGATNRAITGVGFQPDWVWIKGRSYASNHLLSDAVRGTGKSLFSNLTEAESTTRYLSAFGSDGFTTGPVDDINENTRTYVAWNWKANGSTTVTNTAGTITSQVSANPTAGFSIVTYTGNSVAGATRGHGLNALPKMMFIKGRTGTYGADNWHVYHASLPNTQGLSLNSNGATTSEYFWNNTSPTTTVFSTSTGASNNHSGTTYVAYCFAEVAGYSAFGSYTGNGLDNGPFVFTGFKPAFLMIKRTDAASNAWLMYDGTRNTNNLTNKKLAANRGDEENNVANVGDDSYGIDFLSNGFKSVTQTGTNQNASGGSYIFAAFASTPFKYSLAR